LFFLFLNSQLVLTKHLSWRRGVCSFNRFLFY
jgi:hypothetical protein